MRRFIPAVAVVLLTAACSATAHPAVNPTPSSGSASPSITFLPDGVTTALGNIAKDTKKIAQDHGDNSTMATDCQQLGTDASGASAQTIPNQAWQTQWAKMTSELQKAADECSSGASTGDNATMQQALTDLTAADNDIITFNQMTSGS